MTPEANQLRNQQGRHSLVLLSAQEFSQLSSHGSLPLPARHAEHFGRVLRRQSSWAAFVGNGSGALQQAEIRDGVIHLSNPHAGVKPRERSHELILVQSWVKPKALSLILQKAAEIGVDEITLVDSAYSQPHSEKPARIDAILENACMQAYNPLKPRVTFAENIAALNPEKGSFFFGNPQANLSIRHITRPAGSACVFINGPEGGFSPAEIRSLSQTATGILLSENVLRAETAAIIALGFLRLPP